MGDIDKMKTDGRFDTMSKRERLQVNRQREKLEKDLGSIADLTRLPAALFIVDVNKEHIAVREARKLNIPTFAIVDTNADPRSVDFPIPGNDDASAAIDKILEVMTAAIKEGLSERKADKEAASKEAQAVTKEEKEAQAETETTAAEEAKG
jgi:small subunit ribosomal protein S2